MYQINKGINRSLEFKGIKAQYILYLAAGFIILLLLFTILYLLRAGTYLSLSIVLPSGAGLFVAVQYYSRKYGEHGLLKQSMLNRLPTQIRSTSRKSFTKLNNKNEKL